MRILLYLVIGLCCFSCDNTTTETPSKSSTVTEKEVDNKPSTSKPKKTIIFFGDSLTAAYGIDEEQGFTSIIQRKIDSLDLNYKVVNAGLSGETTAGGVGRINWILKQPVDIFVLELGGNDGLRGIDPAATYDNLTKIAETVKSKYPEATLVIAGMEAPPNMGTAFTTEFRKVFQRVAKEQEALLIPFLLEKVGGKPELNLPDGIHPTAQGHQLVAETIWETLQKAL